MVTLKHIVFDLLDVIRQGKQSDDDPIPYRQVAWHVHNVRAKLIREDLAKNRSVSDNIKQSLGCMDVSKVDASLCCSTNIDCDVYRTDMQIPQPVELLQKDLITRVGSIVIGSKPYVIVPIERIPYIGFTPFSGINNAVYCSIVNRYIFIFMKKKNKVIKKITCEGVWADPTEVSGYTTCESNACYTDDSYYPISQHMIEPLKQIILANNLKLEMQAPADLKGNAQGTTETTVNREG